VAFWNDEISQSRRQAARNQSLTRRRSFRSTLKARFPRQWLPTHRSIVGECASMHSGGGGGGSEGCAKRGMKSVIGNHFSFSARSARVLSLLPSPPSHFSPFRSTIALSIGVPECRSAPARLSSVIHYGRTHPAKQPARILFGLISSICPRRVYMRRRGGLFSEWKRVRRRSSPRLFRERRPDIPSAIHSLVRNDTQWLLWPLHFALASKGPRLLVNYVARRFASWRRYSSARSLRWSDDGNERALRRISGLTRYLLPLKARYSVSERGQIPSLDNAGQSISQQARAGSTKSSGNGIDRRASETSAPITSIISKMEKARHPRVLIPKENPPRRWPRAPQGSSKTAASTSKGVDESARQIELGLCKTRPKAAERKPGSRVAERDEMCNTLSLSCTLRGRRKGSPSERRNFAAVSRSSRPNAGPRRFRGDYTMKYISPLPPLPAPACASVSLLAKYKPHCFAPAQASQITMPKKQRGREDLSRRVH